MNTITLPCLIDPGHAWLIVQVHQLTDLKIEHDISHYSYQHGKEVFLEEDSDAPKFIRAMASNGIKVITTDTYTDRPSHIRTYNSYCAGHKPN